MATRSTTGTSSSTIAPAIPSAKSPHLAMFVVAMLETCASGRAEASEAISPHRSIFWHRNRRDRPGAVVRHHGSQHENDSAQNCMHHWSDGDEQSRAYLMVFSSWAMTDDGSRGPHDLRTSGFPAEHRGRPIGEQWSCARSPETRIGVRIGPVRCGLRGPSAAGMRPSSLHGRIHGVSPQPVPGRPTPG